MLAALLVTSGCGEQGTSAPETPVETAEPAPQPDHAPAPAAPADAPSAPAAAADTPAPEGACEHAQACCPAYVAALPASGRGEADDACSTLSLAMELEGRPRDEACQGALEGFRASLRATGLDVPEACR